MSTATQVSELAARVRDASPAAIRAPVGELGPCPAGTPG